MKKPTPKRKPAPLDVRTLKWCERMLRKEAAACATAFGRSVRADDAQASAYWSGATKEAAHVALAVKNKIRAIERAGRKRK